MIKYYLLKNGLEDEKNILFMELLKFNIIIHLNVLLINQMF